MQYYNTHAYEYSAKTLPIDLSNLYARFLRTIPKQGFILDAGCGSGRDALHFLKLGYNVKAFDASPELANLAQNLTGLSVKQLTFEDMIPCSIFDGIWANASLLHVPQQELQGVLHTLYKSLKPGGTLYCSFKYGRTDHTDKRGRHYTNQTCESLDKHLVGAGFTGRRNIFIQQSTALDGGLQDWVIGLAQLPQQ